MARAGLGPKWKCTFANDFDEKKCQSYDQNWGRDHLHEGDVGAVSVRDLPGVADLVWASFPCQDLSLAGNGAGLIGKRSGSFWPFWRLIAELAAEQRKPKTIVLENVCGLLTSNDGGDFETIVRALVVEGYQVGAVVINAERFVPQSRPRLFIVGFSGNQEQSIPHACIPNKMWHPLRLQSAVDAMPIFLRDQWLWLDPPKPSKRNQSLIDLLEAEDSVEWDYVEKTNKLVGMMSANHHTKLVEVLRSGQPAVGAVFKRTRVERGQRVQRAEVRFDGIAGCLRTPGGGSSRQSIVMVKDNQIKSRLLTARETARLMGLSDEYLLPTNLNDSYHLTGDGVVVPVVRFIDENIVSPFLAIKAPVHA